MTIAQIASYYPLTSPFGSRPQFGDFHWGQDYATPMGVAIHAHMDCKLVLSGKYGNEWILNLEALDGSHNWTLGHLSETLYRPGTIVKAGTLIGKTGNSGNSTGPHLHIEYDKGRFKGSVTANHNAGTTIDPLPLLQALQGGEQDMTIEEYLSDIFDCIADDPHYAESRPEVFKSHVQFVSGLDWVGRRNWFKQVMTDNGVLSKNRMAEHMLQDSLYQSKAEAEMKALDQKVIGLQLSLEKQLEDHNRVIAKMNDDIRSLNAQLDKALQNAKDVSRWTWQQHLSAAVSLFFSKGGDTR